MMRSMLAASVAALCLITAPASAQSHDSCADALPLAGMSGSVDSNNDLNTASGPPGSCNSSSATTMQNSQWYTYTPPQTGMLIIDFDEFGGFDAIVTVSTGTCGSLVEIACGDEPEPIQLMVPVVQNETVFIAVGDWGTAEGGGPYTLGYTLTTDGDTCADALPITGFSGSVANNNDLNTPSGPPGSCNSSSATTMQNSQWYAYTAPASGMLTIDVDEMGLFDALVTVYSGTCGTLAEIACVDEPEPIQIMVPVMNNETIYIAVGDWGTFEGGGAYLLEYALNADSETIFVDDSPVEVMSTTCGEGNELDNTCMGSYDGGEDKIYRLEVLSGGEYEVALDADTIWAGWAIFAADPRDDPNSCLFQATSSSNPDVAMVDLAPGVYFLMVDTFPPPNCADFTLTISPFSSLRADVCGDAIVATVPYAESLDNSIYNADGPPGSCNPGAATAMQNSQWIRFTAPRDGTIRVTMDDSAGVNFDAILTVSTGSCANLTEIACGDEPEPIVLDVPVVQGETYYVAAGDWGTIAGGGMYDLTIEYPCLADVNGDNVLTGADFNAFLTAFSAMDPAADQNNDGAFTGADFNAFLTNFSTGCP